MKSFFFQILLAFSEYLNFSSARAQYSMALRNSCFDSQDLLPSSLLLSPFNIIVEYRQVNCIVNHPYIYVMNLR